MDRIAALDRAEEILVVVDAEVRVVASLHQHTRTSERERLLDLLEDDGFRQEVALSTVTGPPVEGAEVAIGHAHIRVVDVPVDDERDPVGIGAACAQLARSPADREEVT